jgi:hypothetical protein
MIRRLLALVLLASACHGPDPAKQARDDVRSWSATLALTASSWAGGKVPDVYATKLAQQGDEALAELPKGTPPELIKAASRARTLARELARAVARHDGLRAAALGQALESVAASQKDSDS